MPAVEMIALATSKIFRSKQASAIEVVTRKLDAARTTLAEAEAHRDSRALDIALDPDEFAGAHEFEAVRRAQERVQILERALEDAQAQEDARVAQRRTEEWKSQLRALRQHLGNMIRAAGRYQSAVTEQVAAFDDMLAIADKIRRLLPADPRGDNLRRLIGYHSLRALGQLELDRQGSPASGDVDGRPSVPGTAKHVAGFFPLSTPALADDIERRLLGSFGLLAGGALDPPTPAPAAKAKKSPVAAVEEIADPPDPTVPVHSDPEVQAEFEAARELMRGAADRDAERERDEIKSMLRKSAPAVRSEAADPGASATEPPQAETENLEILAEPLREDGETTEAETANTAAEPDLTEAETAQVSAARSRIDRPVQPTETAEVSY